MTIKDMGFYSRVLVSPPARDVKSLQELDKAVFEANVSIQANFVEIQLS
ncbi:MAG UNVERIFIED_CONTAM: hypothetical protein LVR29_19045 [Microcystis novacekii LVE1205-3]